MSSQINTIPLEVAVLQLKMKKARKEYARTAKFETLQQCIQANTGIEKDPKGYCLMTFPDLSKTASLKLKDQKLQKSASLRSFDGKFATFFMLKGDEVNGREWGVTEDSIPNNIMTAIGQPYVITSDEFTKASPYGEIYDHPSLEHLVPLKLASPGTVDLNDLPRIMKFQEKFRIGTMIDVFKADDGSWRVIVEIDEPFREMDLPPFVSPAVWQGDMNEPDTAMTKWTVLHLAGLKERPAYGSQAVKKAECFGDIESCDVQLHAASNNPMITPCTMKKIIFDMKTQRLRLAVLDSGDISDTNRQNLHNCTKRDESGNCISTDSKKPI